MRDYKGRGNRTCSTSKTSSEEKWQRFNSTMADSDDSRNMCRMRGAAHHHNFGA